MKKIWNISLGVGIAIASIMAYERIAKLKYEALFNEILDEVDLL